MDYLIPEFQRKNVPYRDMLKNARPEFYLATINTNLAYTCGNITKIFYVLYKARFPKGYFKTDFVSTTIPVNQYKKINSVVDFKQKKPIIALQPKLSTDIDYIAAPLNELYSSSYFYPHEDKWSGLTKFFNDREHKIGIDFNVKRMRMTFDITHIVGTEFQQYDLYGMIANNVRCNHPYKQEVVIEVEIPDNIILQTSKHSGIPIFDKNGNIKQFLDYMNKMSKVPVTYKLKTATGRKKFFMMLVTNMMIQFDTPNIGDGDRDGMTTDDYPITISAVTEFNYPGAFYYISEKLHDCIELDSSIYEETKDQDKKKDEDGESGHMTTIGDNGDLSLMYTFQTAIIPQYSLKHKFDLNFYTDIIPSDEKDDVTDIRSLIELDIQDAVIDCFKNKDNPSLYFDVEVNCEGTYLQEKDYYIDFLKMELHLLNCNINKTCRVFVFVDNQLVNNYILKNHKY